MKRALIFIIKIYQKTLSPDHGLLKTRYPYGFCRYYPSCSAYAIDALEEYGIVKGLFKAGMRILKCNPFARPGIDIIKNK
jgi:putative membrane protein insertion efficiency factor